MSANFDWARLAGVVEPKRDTQQLLWDDVRSGFRKIAWDVYKPLSGSDQLWELRDGEDGNKYLFAMYENSPVKTSEEETPPDELKVTASSDWAAICDRDRKNITLSFKGYPLKRFSSDEFKFMPDDAERFAAFLQSKTASSDFVKQVIKGLPLNTAGVLSELKTNSEG
jgi:hypothetical protein